MKKLLYILFICLCPAIATAQGLVKPELPMPDTTGLDNKTLNIEKPQADSLHIDRMSIFHPDLGLITFPKLNLDDNLLNMKQDYNYYIYNPDGFNNMNFPFVASPFINSATIFNQAAYRLSDKFLVGGNSFGARSIFSNPLPSIGTNKYDLRGASMFIQYKVSKNVKIETHVSVTNRRF